MSADQYLQTILNREAVDTSVYSPVLNVQATIRPLIARWAATLCSRLVRADPLLRVPQTDIDLFISLSESTPDGEIFYFGLSISPSGSFAKGTANRSGTDIDLFISLSESTPETLKEIYDSLTAARDQKSVAYPNMTPSVSPPADLRNIFLDPRPLDSYSSRTPLWRCRSQNRPSTGKRLRDPPSMFRRADFRLW